MIKNILLTETTGFISPNFVPYFLEKYPKYNLINSEPLTYAGNLENLKKYEDNLSINLAKNDSYNHNLVEFIFTERNRASVIHFAAEPHISNSTKSLSLFIEKNINNTFTSLNSTDKYWLDVPFTYKDKYFAQIAEAKLHIQ